MATSISSSITDHSNTTSKTMAFRKAHCLDDGQLTPPSSPDALPQRVNRHTPRLQLSRLLRRPRMTKALRPPVDFHDQSLVPTLKEPFPLLLPESPVETDVSSACTVSPIGPPELRRVSASYRNLRTLAAQQSILKPSQPGTPLLPSPITHDVFEQDDTYFQFHNPRPPRSDGDYKSYEDMHILSCYYDDTRAESMNEIERELDDDNVSEALLSPGHANDTSTASEDTPQTPNDREHRPSCCSPESDWLANETTPSERMRRFKARCYQVVQHPRNDGDERKNENGILLATVLGIARKPKLVQISRPSSGTSPRASRTNRSHPPPQTPTQHQLEVSAFSPYDTPGEETVQITNLSPALVRSTTGLPGPSYSSVSLVPAPLSLTTRTHSYQSCSTAFSNTRRHLENFADPFSFSPAWKSRCESDQDISPTTLPDNSTDVLRPVSSYVVNQGRSPNPELHSSPQITRGCRYMPSPTSNHRDDLPRTLEAISFAVNEFTFHSSFSSLSALAKLHLSSPAVLDLRCPLIPDSQYLSMLGKIFPSATTKTRSRQGGEALLSSLAAWIILDLYLRQVIKRLRSRPLHQTFNVDRNSYTSFTFPLPPKLTTSLSLRDVILHRHRHSKQARREQEIAPNQQPNHRHQYSYTTLINQSNSSLHRIPTSARDLLGITHSPSPRQLSKGISGATRHKPVLGSASQTQHQQTQLRPENAGLLQRTMAVQQSVSVIGGKLVEALRGKGGFDDDIWRSLRVLVEVVEEGGWGRFRDAGSKHGDQGEEKVGCNDSGEGVRRRDGENEDETWF